MLVFPPATHTGEQLSWRSDVRSLPAAGGDGQALRCDPVSATLAAKWAAHEGACLCIADGSEGNRLTGGHDAVACLWEGRGKQISRFAT